MTENETTTTLEDAVRNCGADAMDFEAWKALRLNIARAIDNAEFPDTISNLTEQLMDCEHKLSTFR